MTIFNEVFEKLRILAEVDTAGAGSEKRRPSWGPAIVLDDEIMDGLSGLSHPLPGRPVARLWAQFAGRDKVTTYLRDHKSKLPMPEARVRAFELRLGVDRSGERLLWAKRYGDGTWEVSTPIPYKFPREQERLAVNRAYTEARSRWGALDVQADHPHFTEAQREAARSMLPDAEAKLAECKKAYTEITAARDGYVKRQAAFGDLIKQRVAEFSGDPRAEMIAGAHVTGNCAICGRGLSDARSIERGVGPECYSHIAPDLRAFLDHQQEHAA